MSIPLTPIRVVLAQQSPRSCRRRQPPAVAAAIPRRSAAAASGAAWRRSQPAARASASIWLPLGHRLAAGISRSSSGGSQGPVGLDDEVLYSKDVPLSKLQAQLEAAVEAEEYDTAAALRDVLQRRRFDARLAVEEANERFYKAFQGGSLAAMGEVWGTGEQVQCIHPLSNCIAGRAAVMDSWKAILGSGRMRITLENVRISASDSHAFVTCVEINESGDGKGRIAATNVFEKQEGAWKLVHHHGSPAPVMR